jgi:hypothetical protein
VTLNRVTKLNALVEGLGLGLESKMRGEGFIWHLKFCIQQSIRFRKEQYSQASLAFEKTV